MTGHSLLPERTPGVVSGHPTRPTETGRGVRGCLVTLVMAAVMLSVVVGAAWGLSQAGVWWVNSGWGSVGYGENGAGSDVDTSEPVTPYLKFDGFNAGNIISDADLHRWDSMSEADIRSFIDEWNAGCQPGADGTPCLSQWAEDVPSFDEDQYCWAFEGGYLDVAQVIDRAARACEVNPQALLVILQKEQGLITASGHNLKPFRYRSAMGYACPDHGDCDPEFHGLGRQVYYAARQFQKYRITPEKYQFHAGQSQFVPYAADASCGGSEVFIENQATASLYNYTPHQPHAMALRSVEGSCSSWGNLYFYAYWQAWFGQ